MKQASHQSRYLNYTLNNAKKFGGTFVTFTEVIYKGFKTDINFTSMETRLHKLYAHIFQPCQRNHTKTHYDDIY